MHPPPPLPPSRFRNYRSYLKQWRFTGDARPNAARLWDSMRKRGAAITRSSFLRRLQSPEAAFESRLTEVDVGALLQVLNLDDTREAELLRWQVRALEALTLDERVEATLEMEARRRELAQGLTEWQITRHRMAPLFAALVAPVLRELVSLAGEGGWTTAELTARLNAVNGRAIGEAAIRELLLGLEEVNLVRGAGDRWWPGDEGNLVDTGKSASDTRNKLRSYYREGLEDAILAIERIPKDRREFRLGTLLLRPQDLGQAERIFTELRYAMQELEQEARASAEGPVEVFALATLLWPLTGSPERTP